MCKQQCYVTLFTAMRNACIRLQLACKVPKPRMLSLNGATLSGRKELRGYRIRGRTIHPGKDGGILQLMRWLHSAAPPIALGMQDTSIAAETGDDTGKVSSIHPHTCRHWML